MPVIGMSVGAGREGVRPGLHLSERGEEDGVQTLVRLQLHRLRGIQPAKGGTLRVQGKQRQGNGSLQFL